MLVSFAMSAVGTLVLRQYARSRDLYDQPNDRSSHSIPTPRLGGIAVAAASLAGWAAVTDVSTPGVGPTTAIVGGAVVVALLGMADDVRSLSPLLKLSGEVLAVLVPVFFWTPSLSVVVALALVMWLLTYINFFNFMDGSDGLAAGVAVLTALGLSWLAADAHAESAKWMALVIAAAAAGFLVFNFPPASVFMGDTGSLFLGYSIAVLTVVVCGAGAGVLSTGMVLTPFLFDAGLTLAIRVGNREPIWQAHRSHIYQRLLKTGVSHLHVAALYWGWVIVAIGLALRASRSSAPLGFGFALVTMVPGAALLFYARSREAAATLKDGP